MRDDDERNLQGRATVEVLYQKKAALQTLIEQSCLQRCVNKSACSQDIFGKIILITLRKNIAVRFPRAFVKRVGGRIAMKRVKKCLDCNILKFQSIDAENFQEPVEPKSLLPQPNSLCPDLLRVALDVISELSPADQRLFVERFMNGRRYNEIAEKELAGKTPEDQKKIINTIIQRTRRLPEKIKKGMKRRCKSENKGNLISAMDRLEAQQKPRSWRSG